MKKAIILLVFMMLFVRCAQGKNVEKELGEILSRIDVINAILDDPSQATMENLSKYFISQHSEIEIDFYSKFVSNGSETIWEEKGEVYNDIVKHTWPESEKDPSIVLQYLRLSIMAMSDSPGLKKPLAFVYKGYEVVDGYNVIVQAEITLRVWGKNKEVTVPAILWFYYEEDHDVEKYLCLRAISINGFPVFGWWKFMDENKQFHMPPELQ